MSEPGRGPGASHRCVTPVRMVAAVMIGVLVCASVTACSPAATTATPPGPADSPGRTGVTTATGTIAIDTSTKGTIAVPSTPDATRCDPIDPGRCLLPYPNDYFTVPDTATATGRRVHFDPASMPANTNGVPIDPTDWNRADGFSPGSSILVTLGALDLARSGAAPITDIGASLHQDAPIVVLDATAGTRVPYWAEMDQHNPTMKDDERALIVQPAVSLPEGHHVLVALRGLARPAPAASDPITASDGFRAYRDRLATGQGALEARRRHFEELFAGLDTAGVHRGDLQLAWDFTVASTRDRSERVLAMRDDALAQLHDAAPAFSVTSVVTPDDPRVGRRVQGTFRMPSYLTGDGSVGSTLELGADGLPRENGTIALPFACVIPAISLRDSAATAARASIYGHGLFNDESEIDAGAVRDMAQEHDIVFCGSRWIGLSSDDPVFMGGVLTDFSHFPSTADRLQQAIVASIVLGRLMTRANGLLSNPAFQRDGHPVYNPADLFYDGNSLGGVVGGAAVALSPDIHRAVLGVPGMNFSLLLPRSTDYAQFAPIYWSSYPDPVDQTLIFDIAQILWDRGETDGYAQHLTDHALPATPTKAVLLDVAFGDFQVSPAAAEIEARTIGARVHQPALAPGRSPDVVAQWGIGAVAAEESTTGSALVIWDSGSPPPPLTNVAPRAGIDPHEHPRNTPAARSQKSDWLEPDGHFTDPCAAAPCVALKKS